MPDSLQKFIPNFTLCYPVANAILLSFHTYFVPLPLEKKTSKTSSPIKTPRFSYNEKFLSFIYSHVINYRNATDPILNLFDLLHSPNYIPYIIDVPKNVPSVPPAVSP